MVLTEDYVKWNKPGTKNHNKNKNKIPSSWIYLYVQPETVDLIAVESIMAAAGGLAVVEWTEVGVSGWWVATTYDNVTV